MTKNSNKKRWSIVALSSAAVLAATLIPLSVKYCSAVKTIEKRDEEIKLLKLKISSLSAEKEKLISERDELSKKLSSLQTKYDELKLNYDKTLTNFKSITGSILDRSNNYKSMLERYYNNADTENEAENTNNNEEVLSFEAELEKIRNGIQEKITQYVKLLTEKIDLYKSKNAELMNNNDEINLLIDGLEDIKNFGVNIPLETSEDIVKATQWISMSDKEVLSILEKINAKYENYISELKETITQKDKIIENSFNTARELVNQAIKTTENQIDYLATLKEIVYKFVNRDYSSYGSDEFANSMRNEALSLINEINDYSSTAQKVLDQAKADYQKALKSKNIEDFSNINIESFPIKNKTFTKLIEALNQRDYEALFNKNAENWINYTKALHEYKLKQQENSELQQKINLANNTIETLKLDITNKESLITNLETKLKDNLVNTITHTSDLLNDLITTLETDNLKEINEIATPLKEQYEILKQVLLEVNEADFAEKNSEKVYLAIDTIQNILETYKSARVLPLEAIVINLAEKIRELNEERDSLSTELESANNTIKTKENEIENLNTRILELSENITENEAQIENLNKQRSALISEKEQLTLEKTTLISKLSAKENELSSKNTEYEQAKANYETQLREKDLRISELERQLREQGGSNSALESEIAALKRDKTRLSSQVSSLTNQLSTVKSERDSLNSQLRNAKATIAERDTKIKQLEKDVKYWKEQAGKNNPNFDKPTPPAPLPEPVKTPNKKSTITMTNGNRNPMIIGDINWNEFRSVYLGSNSYSLLDKALPNNLNNEEILFTYGVTQNKEDFTNIDWEKYDLKISYVVNGISKNSTINFKNFTTTTPIKIELNSTSNVSHYLGKIENKTLSRYGGTWTTVQAGSISVNTESVVKSILEVSYNNNLTNPFTFTLKNDVKSKYVLSSGDIQHMKNIEKFESGSKVEKYYISTNKDTRVKNADSIEILSVELVAK